MFQTPPLLFFLWLWRMWTQDTWVPNPWQVSTVWFRYCGSWWVLDDQPPPSIHWNHSRRTSTERWRENAESLSIYYCSDNLFSFRTTPLTTGRTYIIWKWNWWYANYAKSVTRIDWGFRLKVLIRNPSKQLSKQFWRRKN